MNLERWRGILVLGEQKTFREIAEIVKIANNSNEIMTRMFSEVTVEIVTTHTREIKTLEQESDQAAFAVKHDVMNGAVNPTVLDDLLQCVDVADSMVDDYYYLAREVSRMMRVQSDEGESRKPIFDSECLDLFNLISKSLAILQQILQASDLTTVRKERREIETLEEEGDEIKDAAFDKLYTLASKMEFILFTHYSLVFHQLDDILDSCEDLSDLLLAIMSSVSK